MHADTRIIQLLQLCPRHCVPPVSCHVSIILHENYFSTKIWYYSIYIVAKVVRKTSIVKADQMDLVTDLDIIDKYEAAVDAEHAGEQTKLQKFFDRFF